MHARTPTENNSEYAEALLEDLNEIKNIYLYASKALEDILTTMKNTLDLTRKYYAYGRKGRQPAHWCLIMRVRPHDER
ncbi:hypothetical protein Y032_0508g2703 [Ancylostoma ceylanicum]|uniref:Uncharacterized protein n=1 Tax=Ancylostoma ceylanicum TaxID=53326 RepID=A0A016WTP6_9BILA|nr:hypothetical protein Y032_0508g2703 [Ancylostoma ceylanicum]